MRLRHIVLPATFNLRSKFISETRHCIDIVIALLHCIDQVALARSSDFLGDLRNQNGLSKSASTIVSTKLSTLWNNTKKIYKLTVKAVLYIIKFRRASAQ